MDQMNIGIYAMVIRGRDYFYISLNFGIFATVRSMVNVLSSKYHLTQTFFQIFMITQQTHCNNLDYQVLCIYY